MPSKPRTEKQIAASRANGAKSNGPTTPEGKANSSKNAIRHGLLAKSFLFEVEQPERFLELLNDLTEEHDPLTATEHILVENMATACWQMRRTRDMQKASVDLEMSRIDPCLGNPAARAGMALHPNGACSPELMLRYAIAADRQFHRSLARLHKLEDRRTAKGTQQPIESKPPQVEPEISEEALPTDPPEPATRVAVETAKEPQLGPRPAISSVQAPAKETNQARIRAILEGRVTELR